MHCVLNIITSISLLIFPISFSVYVRKVWNIFLSSRLSQKINSSKSIYLEAPFFGKGHKYIHIGEYFSSGPGFRIECWDKYQEYTFTPNISIGNNVHFNYRCHIGAINSIVIGDNVLVGSNVLITDHAHGNCNYDDLLVDPFKRKLYSKGRVIIEDNVWIGENCCILPNVVIGHNSVIGANSVVTKTVPPFSVVAGNPARILSANLSSSN